MLPKLIQDIGSIQFSHIGTGYFGCASKADLALYILPD